MADNAQSQSAGPTEPVRPTGPMHRAIVKSVVSADAVIIRGQPKGGPPPEKQINLSNINAPRMARRPAGPDGIISDTKDEPFAWEAREYVRKKLVGQEIQFTVDYKVPNTGREYVVIYLGSGDSMENLTESLVSEGLAEVRPAKGAGDEAHGRLMSLQDAAKSAKKGKWAEDAQQHVRDVTWAIDNPRQFIDSMQQKEIDAVIEHVRDGSTVRAFLLPDFQYVTIMLSGIKAPTVRLGAGGEVVEAEQFALEARFFTESRLLQRDVKVVLESVSNQNFIGSVLHPKGNIAELLLREGFAKCVDWSIAVSTAGPEKLRAAEKHAKTNRLRLWKDYEAPVAQLNGMSNKFTAKVLEINLGESMNVLKPDGTLVKVWLSSVRGPRRPAPGTEQTPAGRDFRNIGEAVVQRGLCTVARHGQDDQNRSSCYDALLAAEAKAEKDGRGVHAKGQDKTAAIVRDANKGKQFLPYLQRAGRVEAVVEFVASGSRMRVYIPRETCLCTLLLAGVNVPRGARPAPGGARGAPMKMLEAEPFGEEATIFTKKTLLQHEVEIEVDSMDKAGNFIGWAFIDGHNFSETLMERGLASLHFSADRSKYFARLSQAEENAKEAKLKIWHNYVPESETAADDIENMAIADAPSEDADGKKAPPPRRVTNYKRVMVTDCSRGEKFLRFAAQLFDDGERIESLQRGMREAMAASPPLPGSHRPQRGQLCAAKFDDGQWYRAKVEAVRGGTTAEVLFVDFGNRASVDASTHVAALPAEVPDLMKQAALAREFNLALVNVPPDEDGAEVCLDTLRRLVLGRECELNVEYRSPSAGGDFVTLLAADKADVGKTLLEAGAALIDPRPPRRGSLEQMLTDYAAAQETAKRERRCLWRYGDFTSDE